MPRPPPPLDSSTLYLARLLTKAIPRRPLDSVGRFTNVGSEFERLRRLPLSPLSPPPWSTNSDSPSCPHNAILRPTTCLTAAMGMQAQGNPSKSRAETHSRASRTASCPAMLAVCGSRLAGHAATSPWCRPFSPRPSCRPRPSALRMARRCLRGRTRVMRSIFGNSKAGGWSTRSASTRNS